MWHSPIGRQSRRAQAVSNEPPKGLSPANLFKQYLASWISLQLWRQREAFSFFSPTESSEVLINYLGSLYYQGCKPFRPPFPLELSLLQKGTLYKESHSMNLTSGSPAISFHSPQSRLSRASLALTAAAALTWAWGLWGVLLLSLKSYWIFRERSQCIDQHSGFVVVGGFSEPLNLHFYLFSL